MERFQRPEPGDRAMDVRATRAPLLQDLPNRQPSAIGRLRSVSRLARGAKELAGIRPVSARAGVWPGRTGIQFVGHQTEKQSMTAGDIVLISLSQFRWNTQATASVTVGDIARPIPNPSCLWDQHPASPSATELGRVDSSRRKRLFPEWAAPCVYRPPKLTPRADSAEIAGVTRNINSARLGRLSSAWPIICALEMRTTPTNWTYVRPSRRLSMERLTWVIAPKRELPCPISRPGSG